MRVLRAPRALPALVGFLLLSALAPAAHGQAMSTVAFDVAVTAPTDAQEPGNRTAIQLAVARVCPNMVAVLEQQTVRIEFRAPAGAAVAGPAQAVFPQQVCAQEPRHVQMVDYTVTVPDYPALAEDDAEADDADDGDDGDDGEGDEDGRTSRYRSYAQDTQYTVTVSPGYSGPLVSQGPEVQVAFTIGLKWPEPALSGAAAEPVEKAMPSPAFAAVGLALLALAVALRRRA